MVDYSKIVKEILDKDEGSKLMSKVLDYSNMTAEEFRVASEKVLEQMASVEQEVRSLEEEKKRRASAQVSGLVQEAYNKLHEAEKIANEYGIVFSFSPAYGMGGTYYPPRNDDYNDSDDWYDSDEQGWVSSSEQC